MKKAGTKLTIKVLPVSALRTDGNTFPRKGLILATVEHYSDEMRDGAKFPPVDVFYDGADYWLAHGFHRVAAAISADLSEIDCRIYEGTRKAAQLFGCGANKDNGLPRSAKDTTRAVRGAVAHPLAAAMSNRAVAKHVGVSEHRIAEERARLARSGSAPAVRTGANSRRA